MDFFNISLGAFAFIGGFALFMLCLFFIFLRKDASFSVPNVITTVGILGTFMGITYGLLNFDVNNIQESVPELLEGLKVAFSTSIIGMILAVLYRVIPRGKAEIAGSTIDTLATILTDMSKSQQEHFTTNSNQLANMEKALIGDGDSTLLTQIQKLRTSFSDKQDELIKEFQEFADKVTETNMEALTKAIQELITDFNIKITEQFGDNFKQLNQAVKKILEWQEKYKEQVDKMVGQLEISISSVKQSEESLKNISERSKSIIDMTEKLDHVLKVLIESLGTFSEMASNAKEAFPIIEKEIKRLTSDFSEAVTSAVDENKKMLEFQQSSLTAQSETLTNAHKDTSEAISRSFNSMNTQIERLISENLEKVRGQIELVDKSLGEELNKALNTLGSQLHSLSMQFVADYTPLTDRLKKVVELAKGL